MKKLSIISLILFLILFTALIKNSTKKIEDEIFTVKESLIGFKKELGDAKLEFNYLSSAEKLLDYQSMYFEEDLSQKDIKEIRVLVKNSDDFEIKNLIFTTKND
ncbi:cell division protein FtsL [Candidatus Pelagibacter sp.]|nr:cell division protein FtsL [Candidatus Pelagibacter sp.]